MVPVPQTTERIVSVYGPCIWIEGSIGSGKTTLADRLGAHLGLRVLHEPVDANPYLEVFYQDPKRWAFPMQLELLHRRYAMQKLAAFEATGCGENKGAILDRGMPGDRVFCKMHHLAGNISELEWKTYERAYSIMACSLVPPSLLIFLDVDPEVAFERVRKRARGCEAGVPLAYLRDLRKGYLDLMVEIESGQHAWSRGMRVMRLAWNYDDQPIGPLVERLRHEFRL